MEQMPNLPRAEHYEESDAEQMLRQEIFGRPPPLLARFYYGAEKDHEKTEAEGVPVYRDKLLVLIQVTGERDCMTSEVTEEHKKRFPREFALFQKSSKFIPVPLQALPQMTPAIREAMQEVGIRCVQDLVEKDVPGYLNKWKPCAQKLMLMHEFFDKPKPRLKLVEGQMIAA